MHTVPGKDEETRDSIFLLKHKTQSISKPDARTSYKIQSSVIDLIILNKYPLIQCQLFLQKSIIEFGRLSLFGIL